MSPLRQDSDSSHAPFSYPLLIHSLVFDKGGNEEGSKVF